MTTILYSGNSIQELDLETVRTGLGGVLWAGTFDPGAGVLEALVESGKLELILNSRLKDKLSSWSSIMDETRDNEELMRAYVMHKIIPFVSSMEIDIYQITPNQVYREWATAKQPKTSPRLSGYRDLLLNNEFRNLAIWKHHWVMGSKDEFANAANNGRDILDLIRQELKR